MMLVDDFSAVLKRKMGLDSGSIGAAAVERAVRHRMQSVGSDDEHDYLMRLQTSPAEMQQLIEAVIVPETWFFRYPESQEAMAALARERLFAPGAEARQLRVLSVPCSSGEEPYSIAMALLDAGVPAARFQVDAVDISERMVAFAQRACYGRNSFRGESLSYRDRYFTETADGHQLAGHVTARVRFQAGNLFDPDLLPNAAPYDFVFCRNLLIYFDAPTQERAVTVLRRFARQDGILFVGPAETSLMTGRRLPAVPLARAFAFRAEPAPPTEAGPDGGRGERPRHAAARRGAARGPALDAGRASTALRAGRPGAAACGIPGAARSARAVARARRANGPGHRGSPARDRRAGRPGTGAGRPGAVPRPPRAAWRQRRGFVPAGPAAGRRRRHARGPGCLPQGAVPEPCASGGIAAPGGADRGRGRSRRRPPLAGARRAPGGPP